MNQNIKQTAMTLDEVHLILSETLRGVVSRKISLKHAQVISKLATNMTKIITTTELEEKIILLENTLKGRK